MPFFDVGSLAPFKPSNLQGLKLSNFKLSSFDNFEFEEPRSGHQAQASTSKRAACERALFNALDAEQSFFSCASRRRWERQSASGTLRSTAEHCGALRCNRAFLHSVPVRARHAPACAAPSPARPMATRSEQDSGGGRPAWSRRAEQGSGPAASQEPATSATASAWCLGCATHLGDF